jgi:hypothetical protein
MELPDSEGERIEAQSQAEDRRAKWERPALRRLEAGRAEIGEAGNPDLDVFS